MNIWRFMIRIHNSSWFRWLIRTFRYLGFICLCVMVIRLFLTLFVFNLFLSLMVDRRIVIKGRFWNLISWVLNLICWFVVLFGIFCELFWKLEEVVRVSYLLLELLLVFQRVIITTILLNLFIFRVSFVRVRLCLMLSI